MYIKMQNSLEFTKKSYNTHTHTHTHAHTYMYIYIYIRICMCHTKDIFKMSM